MKLKIYFSLCLLGILNSSVSAQDLAQQDDHDLPEFNPVQVVRPFDAIVNAPTVSANDPSNSVKDDELVIGLEINGQSRAYPINMLNGPTREIINDTLGEKKIATTW